MACGDARRSSCHGVLSRPAGSGRRGGAGIYRKLGAAAAEGPAAAVILEHPAELALAR